MSDSLSRFLRTDSLVECVQIHSSHAARFVGVAVGDIADAAQAHADGAADASERPPGRLKVPNHPLPRNHGPRLRKSVAERNSRSAPTLPPNVRGGDYSADMSYGPKIKARRLELKKDDPVRYSIKAVANAVGMAHSTLYDLERGDRQKTHWLLPLCRYLGLNPDWVERGVGSRLVTPVTVSAPQDPIQPTTSGDTLVQTDQKESSGGTDVGMLAKRAFEAGLMLTAMPDPVREAFFQSIRAAYEALKNAKATDPSDDEGAPPTSANLPGRHIAK